MKKSIDKIKSKHTTSFDENSYIDDFPKMSLVSYTPFPSSNSFVIKIQLRELSFWWYSKIDMMKMRKFFVFPSDIILKIDTKKKIKNDNNIWIFKCITLHL